MVNNLTNIESVLNKKYSVVSYHCVRWAVAVGVVDVAWIKSQENLVDAFMTHVDWSYTCLLIYKLVVLGVETSGLDIYGNSLDQRVPNDSQCDWFPTFGIEYCELITLKYTNTGSQNNRQRIFDDNGDPFKIYHYNLCYYLRFHLYPC